MMTVDLRELTLTERRNGFVYAQPQPYGAQGTTVAFEAHAPFGLMGRPRDGSDSGGPSGFVFMHGSEGFILPTTDPRYQASLPDTGEGGAGLYATAAVNGTVQTPTIAIYGANGAQAEGTVQIVCKSDAGDSTMTWNPTTGDVTIAHPAGTKALVKADAVYLGDEAGAFPLMKETGEWAAFAGQVAAAFQGLGITTVVAPTSYVCTKAKAL